MANINGKPVLASGTHLFQTGDHVQIAGNINLVFSAKEGAPFGINSKPIAGGFAFSLDGFDTVTDGGTNGTGTVNGMPIRFMICAMRTVTLSPTEHLYRVEYTFVAA